MFVDWSQNNPAKTTVAPYSLRARPHPTVSTPVSWEEVAACRTPEQLVFTSSEVLTRVEDRDRAGAQRAPGPAPRRRIRTPVACPRGELVDPLLAQPAAPRPAARAPAPSLAGAPPAVAPWIVGRNRSWFGSLYHERAPAPLGHRDAGAEPDPPGRGRGIGDLRGGLGALRHAPGGDVRLVPGRQTRPAGAAPARRTRRPAAAARAESVG